MAPTKHLVVLDIKRRTLQDLRALAKHCARTGGNLDHIASERTHLNRALVGALGEPEKAAQAYLKATRARVDRRNVKPYTALVLSASSDYFRPGDPDAAGTWDEARLDAWEAQAVTWLRDRFGADLVHAETHLDEGTPHIHAVVVPTYQKVRKGKPGRRGVSHHKHPAFAGRNSYHRLLDSYTEAVSGLGLRRRRAADTRPPMTKHDHARAVLDAAEETERAANIDRLDALVCLSDATTEKATAAQMKKDARQTLARAEARERAFLVGIGAVTEDKLRYLPPSEERPQASLTKGPAFPDDKETGRRLVDAIRPAWGAVVKAAGYIHAEHERIRAAWKAVKAGEETNARERSRLDDRADSLCERARIVGDAEMSAAEARHKRRRIDARGVARAR